MIDESYLKNQSTKFAKYSSNLNNLKTLLSGESASKHFSSYTPDFNEFGDDVKNQMNDALNSATDQMHSVVGQISSTLSSVRIPSMPGGGKKVDGDGPSGGILEQLVALIIGIAEVPIRMMYIGEGLVESTIALALSMEGLGQSIALAGEDLWYLIVAIAVVVWKYALCMISFVITTIAGCFMVHIFTFLISVLFLIFPLSAYVFEYVSGIDISPQIDEAFEKMHEFDHILADYTGMYLMQWPDSINLVCYTCFGSPVKMKDILTDVWSIKSAGDMISYDFSVRMPQYMKNAVPPADAAGTAFNKAMN